MNNIFKTYAIKISGKRSYEFIEYCNKFMKKATLFEYKCNKNDVTKEIISIAKYYTVCNIYKYFLSDTHYKTFSTIDPKIYHEYLTFGTIYKNYININCFKNFYDNDIPDASTQIVNIHFEKEKYRMHINTYITLQLYDECGSGNECQSLREKYGVCRCNDIIGLIHFIQIPKVVLWLNKKLDDYYTKTEIMFVLSVIDERNMFEKSKLNTYNNIKRYSSSTKKEPINILYDNIMKNKNTKEYEEHKINFYCKYCDKMALYHITKNIITCYKHVYIYYKEYLNQFPECLGKIVTDYLFY